MRILITGASGFIGSRLACHFVEEGVDVAVLLRNSSKTDQLSPCLNELSIYHYSGEFTELTNALQDFQPDIIVHTASLFLSQHSPDQLQDLIQSNIFFPTQLLEAMACCKIDKLINTGTSWQHFEDKDYSPVNLYAATKQAFEDICRYYYEAKDFKIITLKLFDTYGPGDPRKKIIPLLQESIVEGVELDMSPGQQKLDFVHINDVCAAYSCAIEHLLTRDAPVMEDYGISSGKQISLKELVGLIERIADKNNHINWGGRAYRVREVMFPWRKHKELVGWEPLIPFRKGLQQIKSDNQ